MYPLIKRRLREWKEPAYLTFEILHFLIDLIIVVHIFAPGIAPLNG